MEEILETLETCGAAEMPVADSCLIAGLSLDEYNANPEHSKRYTIGRLKTKLRVRQSVIKSACAGDAAAVKKYLEFLRLNTTTETAT